MRRNGQKTFRVSGRRIQVFLCALLMKSSLTTTSMICSAAFVPRGGPWQAHVWKHGPVTSSRSRQFVSGSNDEMAIGRPQSGCPRTSIHNSNGLRLAMLPTLSTVSEVYSSLVLSLSTTISNSLLAVARPSGATGVFALMGIAAAILIPIAQIRNVYAISVGYGLSIAVMALTLRSVFFVSAKAPLTAATHPIGYALVMASIFYGFRLSSYLFLRERSGWKPRRKSAQTDANKQSNGPSRLSRIPFSVSLAIFYAFLSTPLYFSLLRPIATPSFASATFRQQILLGLAWFGTGLGWTGAILEAVADTHKFVVKLRAALTDTGTTKEGTGSIPTFQSPTNGVYRITRHPSYTGEVLFWVGNFVAGIPSFGGSIVAWLCSTIGLYGIVSIMRTASRGLEERQLQRYSGNPDYETWKAKVKAPLIPFVYDEDDDMV